MATYAAYRHVELDNVGYGKKRVLKPPGGGSSDIFGAGNEAHSPRRVKQSFNQSTLGSGFFSNGEQSAQQPQSNGSSQPSSNGGSAPESPRSKPGNDSYKRLFGPPDAPPPSTPNSKYHMRSNISLSSPGSTEPSSPAKQNGNGLASPNSQLTNGNGYHHNDVVAFRRIKRFRGSSCMPRNPVTGDGVDVKPHASRRIVRRSRDGNPVTGAGYEPNPASQQNGTGGKSPSAGSEKSSTDSSPSVASNNPVRMKNRVPPGGFSSGLW